MSSWPIKPGDVFPPTAADMNAAIRAAVAEALDQRPAIVLDDVRRLDAKPGDTIVLQPAWHLPADEARRVEHYVSERLPGVRVLCLPAGVSIESVASAPNPMDGG